MRMDCANLQLAHLADADNRIAPEEYGSLHAGFSVAVLHRRLAELRCGARLLPLVDRRCKNGLARRAPPWGAEDLRPGWPRARVGYAGVASRFESCFPRPYGRGYEPSENIRRAEDCPPYQTPHFGKAKSSRERLWAAVTGLRDKRH